MVIIIENLLKIFPLKLHDTKREVAVFRWIMTCPDRIGFFFVRLHSGKIRLANSGIGESAEIAAENGIAGRIFARAFMWLEHRCPTWPEMVALNELLFIPDEPTFQVHPKKVDYVNNHKTALHIWKPLDDFSYMLLQEMRVLIPQVLLSFAGKAIPSEREVSHGEIWGKHYISIWGGDDWPTWEEVCQIKKKEFGEDVAALQFHISREMDLNKQRVLLLWRADDIHVNLPPKEIV